MGAHPRPGMLIISYYFFLLQANLGYHLRLSRYRVLPREERGEALSLALVSVRTPCGMFSGWSASWKEYRLPESVRGTREFVWRHKYKLLGGTGVVAGALWYYDCLPFVSSSSSSTTSPSSDTGSRAGGGGGVTRPRLNPGTRSRLLLRVRKHFDFAVNDFLPILATKTDTAVDVDTARKQIQVHYN